jgi:dTMP kinase
MSKGVYIVFEGVVGTGKTTQSKRLVEELQQRFPDREVVWTREPGGGEIAEAIRALVQATPFTETMDPICEAYLYASARAQSLRTVVAPVIARQGIVISDRSFLSSIAWQGFGRGLGVDTILQINQVAITEHVPDIIIELDLDPVEGMKRTFDARGDKFETMPIEFFQECVKGYRILSDHSSFKDRWHRIDATGTRDEVFQRISVVCQNNLK